MPASRGAHCRPLHPRLASLCSAQKVVHACRGVLSQNGVEKFHWNCEPRQSHLRCNRRTEANQASNGPDSVFCVPVIGPISCDSGGTLRESSGEDFLLIAQDLFLV